MYDNKTRGVRYTYNNKTNIYKYLFIEFLHNALSIPDDRIGVECLGGVKP